MVIQNDLLLKAEEVNYRYSGPSGGIKALEGINLAVNAGEHVAVLGPNGSGKSTLLKLLNALLIPTAGKITVGGKCTSHEESVWEIRRDCGMVFQNPDNQLVATTVEEEVAFGLENLQIPPEEMAGIVRETLETMELLPWAQHAPHLLSGGQKQRVALASVMAMRPRCLLLDEATSQLDPRGKNEILETLRRLNQQEGIAVINVTHFLEEAVLADRVVVLCQGKIVKDGPSAEVLSDAESLKLWGLEPPAAVSLSQKLKDRGVSLPSNLITVEQLVDQICSWK